MDLHQFRFNAMSCPCELRLYCIDRQQAEQVAEQCIREARRFEQKYSRYLEDSVTSRINQSAGRNPVQIDHETHAILQYSGSCFEQSDGLFDITSGVLRRVWHRELTSIPSEDAIESCKALIGWQKIDLEPDSVYLPTEGMELDFGGVVKEYVADAIAGLARTMGIEHGLVNLGGDICIIGAQPDQKPWSIGIVHPQRANAAIAVIPLSAGALATSGGYERYIEIDGRRYSHLINPMTGWPVDTLLSVSVAADQAVVAGSISSIALLQGAGESLDWLADSEAVYLAVDDELNCYGTLPQESNRIEPVS